MAIRSAKQDFEEHELDPLRIQYERAAEEYEEALKEYERRFGYTALDLYTERHV